jgi:rhodanese-related sulfurtransferase
VKEASENQAAVFLDVRTGDEIKEAHLKSRPFLHVSCTPDDCSELMAKADELLPNKNGTLLLVNVQHLVKRYN